MISQEAILHQKICDYLRLQYPNVLFRTDFAAGIKMTMGQAAKHKRLQSVRAWPDLFIAEPRDKWTMSLATHEETITKYSGLFIEIKAANIYKKDGYTLLANQHVLDQQKVLKQLQDKGYMAVFAVGFDEASEIIDSYLQK